MFSRFLTGIALTLYAACIAASEAGMKPTRCAEEISVHCGRAPSVLWHQERLWVVFAQGEHVYLTYSKDHGRSYSPPVPVNRSPEVVEASGESRPKIAATPEALLISWTQKTEKRFTGNIRFARSTDDGKTFEPPRTINDDGSVTSHRFDSLLVTGEGRVFLTWLDKRDKERTEARGDTYTGSAVYFAVSDDHGRSFSPNKRLAANSCECCRIATAPAERGGAAVFWRHIFAGNTRDHAFAQLGHDGHLKNFNRATHDGWQIEACPHHGPALAPTPKPGRYHLAWFSDGSHHQGVYYGLHDSNAATTTRVQVIDERPGAAHPQVMESQGQVYFAWKYFDGERMHILLAISSNGGLSWSEPRSVAATAGRSDHPALVTVKKVPQLAWHTQAEGLQLVPLNSESQAEETVR